MEMYASVPGKNLLEAIDLTNQSFGVEAREEVPVEMKNEQSLAQLDQMMRRVK